MDKKFKYNYCVACKWPKSEGLNTYAYGREVFYGTIKEAKEFLSYVKRQEPKKEWKIYTLIELDVS